MEADPSPSAPATTTMLVSNRSHPDSVLKCPASTAPIAASAIDFPISEEDTHSEQETLRDGHSSLNPWLRYLEYKAKTGGIHGQVFVFEKGCKALPRSYRLWKMYLDLRVKHFSSLNPAQSQDEDKKVNDCLERSLLVLLNKMPRIWTDYLSFLLKQCLVTEIRRTFDRALRALPLTQHSQIWARYLPFANSASGEMAARIWKPYMQVHPEEAEELIELLVEIGKYGEAAQKWIEVLGNPEFRSKAGRSHFQMWSKLGDLLLSHDPEAKGIDLGKIVRNGIGKLSVQGGELWNSLGTYCITKGDFERGRDSFEEGVATVMTVRDFIQIFDSYTEFEESIIGTLMKAIAERQKKGIVNEGAGSDLDIRLMRFEQLIDRRPFLVNDVLLRQNPNNVIEWQKRVALWGDDKQQIVQTYADAVAAVNPKKAVGQFHSLWVGYAKFYEKYGDMKQARTIMEKAVRVPFKSVQELAEMWVEWAELELGNDNFGEAVKIMANATQSPKRSTVDYFDETLTPQQRVHKSWKLWSFYVNLVESVSTLEETKKVYEKIFELGIATPQTVVNYASLLEENKYFEESFNVYEYGLNLFTYPVAFELWNLYLTKAVNRKIDIERLRDIFELALKHCPHKFTKDIYLMYGNFEEERDQPLRARSIYESAIKVLRGGEATEICLKWAEIEQRLGDINRAWSIYVYASSICDLRTSPQLWTKWEAFEIRYGGEYSLNKMLGIKRMVEAKYNDVNSIASGCAGSGSDEEVGSERDDAMEAEESDARVPAGFVPAKDRGEIKGSVGRVVTATGTEVNPDAIDFDMEG